MTESFLTTSSGGTSYRAPLRAANANPALDASLSGVVDGVDAGAMPARLLFSAPASLPSGAGAGGVVPPAAATPNE